MRQARENGETWKLISRAKRESDGTITASVAPERIGPDDPLYSVRGTSLAVGFETDVFRELFIAERDPGPEATAYGMLSRFHKCSQEFLNCLPLTKSAVVARFDVEWARAQFPALQQTVNGRPVVFFDAPGGTQVPQRVIDAISNYLATSNANTHGAFLTSERTDEIYSGAHAAMADFFNCDPDEVVFGANMTTLTFALSRSIGRDLKSGDELLVTQLDHDANVSPWVALEERGAKVRTADIKPADCTLDMFDLQAKVRRSTRLVAVGYAANAVGTINDVAEVVRLAHGVGALAFIDAVHFAPHGLIDVRALDCDFLACSSYKFFGPHLGVMYGKREHLQRLRPYKLRACTEQLPDRWESGTQNHEGMAGVIAAIEYLADLGRHHAPEARVPAVKRWRRRTRSSFSMSGN